MWGVLPSSQGSHICAMIIISLLEDMQSDTSDSPSGYFFVLVTVHYLHILGNEDLQKATG